MIQSAWDSHLDPSRLLSDLAKGVELRCSLLYLVRLFEWNLHKCYLLDLSCAQGGRSPQGMRDVAPFVALSLIDASNRVTARGHERGDEPSIES